MGFLHINGIEVPCDVGTAKLDVEQLGESKRAVDGTLRIHRRVLKRTWDFKLKLSAPVVGEAFRRLVLGEGHNWSFDDAVKGLYSGKGLGPASSTGASLNAAAAYLGARGLRLTSVGNITFKALPINTPSWTVALAWRNGANPFEYIVVTSDTLIADTGWGDGVYGAGSMGTFPSWITVTPSAGTVRIDAVAGAQTDIDELMILPFRIPNPAELESAADDWAAQWYDYQGGYGVQLPPLARLAAYGYALAPDAAFDISGTSGNPPLLCAGQISDLSFQMGQLAGNLIGSAIRPDLKQLAFKLMEI